MNVMNMEYYADADSAEIQLALMTAHTCNIIEQKSTVNLKLKGSGQKRPN